ncbi:hypothetical protein NLJ89_g6509 [Agrocybe chaxingu]|uniref:Uncharacterized protein n=1 Tax=Agrocybe chaxingu TaxID=84603 RepID=A0A9W8JY65_9AGAR|nr:hypothetical protein NLJ89_g6509 [Agrocybe chaxingu]
MSKLNDLDSEKRNRMSLKSVHPYVGVTPKKRLERDLQLSNNAESYKLLRNGIIQISRRHWDLERSSREQKKATKAIEDELVQSFPDLFSQEDPDGVKRLKAAMSYLTHRHGKNVYALKRRSESSKEDDSKCKSPSHEQGKIMTCGETSDKDKGSLPAPSRPDVSPRTIPEASERMPLVERMAANLAHYAGQPSNTHIFGRPTNRTTASEVSQTPASNSTLPLSTPPTRLVPYIAVPKRHTTSSLSMTTGSASSSSQTPCKSSSYLPEPMTSSQSLRATDVALETQDTAGHQMARIYLFLNTCVPPMTHFFQRFIDFGCTTEKHLLSIALLSRDKVELFLKKLPPAPDGTPMSPMEAFILCEQFYAYEYS